MQLSNGFELAFRSMTLGAAETLKVSSIFSNSIHVNGFAFSLDALAHFGTPETGVVNEVAYEKRWAVGLRIALRMTEIKSTAAFTFAAVAAQAELRLANVYYRVEGLGLDDATIEALLEVPIEQSFNAQTYLKIQAAIGKLAAHLKNTPDLVPSEYSVPLPRIAAVDPLVRARTVNYAMAKIARRIDLATAQRSARDSGLDPAGIAVVYATFVRGAYEGDGSPVPEVAARANNWLTSGSSA